MCWCPLLSYYVQHFVIYSVWVRCVYIFVIFDLFIPCCIWTLCTHTGQYQNTKFHIRHTELLLESKNLFVRIKCFQQDLLLTVSRNVRILMFKGTQAWDNFEFFLPKSKPFMPLVNFQTKFWFFSFHFCQNFDVRTFSWWLSVHRTKFFWGAINFFFLQNFHFGPFRWVFIRFFKFDYL